MAIVGERHVGETAHVRADVAGFRLRTRLAVDGPVVEDARVEDVALDKRVRQVAAGVPVERVALDAAADKRSARHQRIRPVAVGDHAIDKRERLRIDLVAIPAEDGGARTARIGVDVQRRAVAQREALDDDLLAPLQPFDVDAAGRRTVVRVSRRAVAAGRAELADDVRDGRAARGDDAHALLSEVQAAPPPPVRRIRAAPDVIAVCARRNPDRRVRRRRVVHGLDRGLGLLRGRAVIRVVAAGGIDVVGRGFKRRISGKRK